MDEYFNKINAVAQSNNEWSAAQAQKQMDFQLMMSNTAHRREMEDLKAAGLNPVLSAHGSGAATTTGAMASADTSNTGALLSLIEKQIDAQGMALTAMAKGKGSGSGSSAAVEGDNFVSGFFNSLPDNGTTSFLGIRLPNSTWKWLYNTVGIKIEDLVAKFGPKVASVVATSAKDGNSTFRNNVEYSAVYDSLGDKKNMWRDFPWTMYHKYRSGIARGVYSIKK